MKYRFKSVNFLFVLLFLLAVFFSFMGVLDAECPLSIARTTTASEGNTGTGLATFAMTTEGETGCASSALFSTSNGTATGGSSCGSGVDFVAVTNGSVDVNETGSTISITICGDLADEVDESFSVRLHNPGAGTIIHDGEGVATIINDDPPNLRINDITINEGNAGQANATFNVTLSSVSGKTVTVNFATAGNTATSGTTCGGNSDFLAASNALSINPGSSSSPITIAVCGDRLIKARFVILNG